MSADATLLDAQLKASTEIADTIVSALTNERGAHAETVVAAAARMAGTFLFRSFGLKTANIPAGSPVLSDVANERGPLLIEVLQAGLRGLKLEFNEAAVSAAPSSTHLPHLTVLETQEALDAKLNAIVASHGLAGESAARSCALATALLIQRTRSVLDPAIGVGIAVYGFVEGTKTMPWSPPQPEPSKPWYKRW